MSSNPLQFLILTAAGWLSRHQQAVLAYLQAENAVLREQLAATGCQPRFTDRQRRRLARAAKGIPRRVLRHIGTIVTPDTLLRWYRRLVAAKYDGSANRRGFGRPPIANDLQNLIISIATKCRSWGYTRIRGVLQSLGITVSRSTIARVLREAGIDPAPERRKGMSWKTFMESHFGCIAAIDTFTVEVLTFAGLVRYHVLFVIDIATRRVEIAGITNNACGRWTEQIARNLTDELDGFLRNTRYLIMDRDPIFTNHFRQILKWRGVEAVRLPVRSPNLNSFAERFVLSIKSECLSKIIPLGERHLRWAIREYAAHYHEERPHQGIGNVIIDPPAQAVNDDREIVCSERLGGVLKHFHRSAT